MDIIVIVFFIVSIFLLIALVLCSLWFYDKNWKGLSGIIAYFLFYFSIYLLPSGSFGRNESISKLAMGFILLGLISTIGGHIIAFYNMFQIKHKLRKDNLLSHMFSNAHMELQLDSMPDSLKIELDNISSITARRKSRFPDYWYVSIDFNAPISIQERDITSFEFVNSKTRHLNFLCDSEFIEYISKRLNQ